MGRYNFAQKVKSLLVNKDQNAAAVLSICIKDYIKSVRENYV